MSRSERNNSSPISLFSFQDVITCLSGIMILMVLIMAINVVLDKSSASTQAPGSLSNRKEELIAKREELENLKSYLETNVMSRTRGNSGNAISRAEEEIKVEKRFEYLVENNSYDENRLENAKDHLSKLNKERDEILEQKKDLIDNIDDLRKRLSYLIENKKVFFIPESGSHKIPYLVECSADLLRVGRLGSTNKPRSIGRGTSKKSMINDFMNFAKTCSANNEYFVFMIKPSSSGYVMNLISSVRELGFDVGYDALEEENSISYAERP